MMIKRILALLFPLTLSLLSACSSTAVSQSDSYPEIARKPLESDQQLLLSLLDRPMTEDMKMMLRFAGQMTEQQTTTTLVNYVDIRGAKDDDKAPYYSASPLMQRVYRDSHAIAMLGPR